MPLASDFPQLETASRRAGKAQVTRSTDGDADGYTSQIHGGRATKKSGRRHRNDVVDQSMHSPREHHLHRQTGHQQRQAGRGDGQSVCRGRRRIAKHQKRKGRRVLSKQARLRRHGPETRLWLLLRWTRRRRRNARAVEGQRRLHRVDNSSQHRAQLRGREGCHPLRTTVRTDRVRPSVWQSR